MSSGVEIDLVCGESDADEFSSSSKTKQTRNVSIEEEQVCTNGGRSISSIGDDDEIAIIESSKAMTQKENLISETSMENNYLQMIGTSLSDNATDETNYNGKRRKTESISSSASSFNATTSSCSSTTGSNSNRQSLHDSNDETMPNESNCIEMKVPNGKTKLDNETNGNGTRKTTNIPTLVITVKNEMAQSTREHTTQSADSSETATLRHIFSDAVYFLIKSGNEENVSLAKSKGIWSTPPANEEKLNKAFRDHRNVILIFSVAESKAFQGFARMSCEARHDSPPVNWILPPGMTNRAFSGVIRIDWITCRSLLFSKTSHLFNSWNENKPVKIGRDGQEIEPRCAEALCRLFPSDPTIDIMSIAKKAKNNKKRCSSRSQSNSPLTIELPSSSMLLEPSPSSSLLIKRSISKDQNHRSTSKDYGRRSPPKDTKHRPTSSLNVSSRHLSSRGRERSPSHHNRHRREQSETRERDNKDFQRKRRRRRSRSSHSNHGEKSSSNRKHIHRSNGGDQSSYNNNNKMMSKLIGSGTCDQYMNHLVASHAQYSGYGTHMFSHGAYPMSYDPAAFYSMGYDHRGMPLPMYSAAYEVPMDMYYPQPTSSMSSRSRNVNEYEQEINAFLRHTTTSDSYLTNEQSIKSHRHHRNEGDYHHKSSSRHRSKSREYRR